MEQRQSAPVASQLSCGIEEMDRAHQVLTRELMHIMQAPDHEFCSRLQRIVALLETDFRIEEELMEEIHYPELRIHRQQHANLLGTLHHVIPQAISGDFCMPRQVLDMLPQWFLGHLVKMDADLVKALNMAGARPVVQADASPV